MKSSALCLLLGLPLLAAAPKGVFEVLDGPFQGSDLDFMPQGGAFAATWTTVGGASDYQWAIGTTPGGQEIQPFTSVGTATSAVSATAFAAAGTLYYVTVKAFDSTLSEVASDTSDGITGFGSPLATALPLSGTAPLTVNFACQLPGVALYEWDFDVPAEGPGKLKSARSLGGPAGVDFSSPTSGNASFTYTSAGSYTAELTLHHQGGEVIPAQVTVDVAAPAGAPSVGVGADVLSGPPPLTVTFTASVSAKVGAYFWDFNEDGVFDASSEGPGLTHTFRTPGLYFVHATVFGANGVGTRTAAPVLIDVTFSGDTPSVSFDPLSGPFRVGDLVSFSATADPGAVGTIVAYHWDLDGNGELDLITSAPSASWRYAAPGIFSARVTVQDSEGLSSFPAFVGVPIDLAPDTPRVWLVEPADGLKVYGNFVTLTAQAVPADQVAGVDFFYREAGTSDPWIPINATPVLPPPVTEFGTHWDVTALAQGAPGFELMARADFGALGTAESILIQTVRVLVDAAAPDLLENSGSPFTKLKLQGVDPNAAANVAISRDMTLKLQAGSTSAYDQMRIERRSENPHPVETTLQGLRFVPGAFRRKSFASGQKQTKPSKVAMYVNKPAGDVLADGTDLNSATFQIMRFNETDKRWEPLYNQTFDPNEKLVKAFAAGTGDVAIAVISNRTASSSSSSGGCGFLGLEVLLAGFAAAGLARRRRGRA